MDLCRECRIATGYKPRDNGFHTAMIMKCEGCGKQRSVLPDRHWVKGDNNG